MTLLRTRKAMEMSVFKISFTCILYKNKILIDRIIKAKILKEVKKGEKNLEKTS